jgi:hypothetical protein
MFCNQNGNVIKVKVPQTHTGVPGTIAAFLKHTKARITFY